MTAYAASLTACATSYSAVSLEDNSVAMRRFLILALLPCLLAADSWVKFASGPFELLTDAGEREGSQTMLRFEEFRYALGHVLGVDDLTAPLPIRILVFKNAKGWIPPAPAAVGRGCYAIALAEKQPVAPEVYGALARLFIDANTERLPPEFEHGLVEFFSGYQIEGIHLSADGPPKGAPPDLDWARVHLLMTAPEYFGKLRVLVFNLRKGIDQDASYRNAFGKTAAAVEGEARRHLAAGNFEPAALENGPLRAQDFESRPVSDTDARLARADLLAGAQSAAEYQALIRDQQDVPDANEGLGLLALRDGRKDEAYRRFADAVEIGSSSAQCYIEYARLEPDAAKAQQALLKAAGINPKLDEPFALLAQRDTDPAKRLEHWKAAAERNPRNAAYWQALAECYLAQHDYSGASKAWASGEQAASDPAERARMRAARAAIEQQRVAYEQEQRRLKAEQDAREIAQLKSEARAELHDLETKSNGGKPVAPSPNAVPWWDGPRPSGKVTGTLKQVECVGKQARLIIDGEDRKTVRLLVADPSKVATDGPGEKALGCGPQKARRVVVLFFPKHDARLGTSGEVASIEFQ